MKAIGLMSNSKLGGYPRLITGRSHAVVIVPRLLHNLRRYARD